MGEGVQENVQCKHIKELELCGYHLAVVQTKWLPNCSNYIEQALRSKSVKVERYGFVLNLV